MKAILFISLIGISQVCAQDTLHSIFHIPDVVVTGQLKEIPESRSTFEIRIIKRSEIEAARDLPDLLQQVVGIDISTNPSTGVRSMSLMGISGENIILLIDGIPVAGRTGDAADLGQIDMSEVERIEIVEGPMAVSYGSNALAGVVNIITLKGSKYDNEIRFEVLEESAGNEYGISRGLHKQSLSLYHRWRPSFGSRVQLSHSFFAGYPASGPDRTTDWDPKTQSTATLILNYKKDKTKIRSRSSWLNEEIINRGAAFSIFQPLALDDEYHTTRLNQVLEWEQRFRKSQRFKFSTSLTDYRRRKNQYVKDLSTGSSELSLAAGAQDTAHIVEWLARTHFQSSWNKISARLGAEFGSQGGSGGRIKGNDNSIITYALFAITEWDASTWFSLRAGYRWSYNDGYGGTNLPSVNLKFDPFARLSVRLAYARGFRAPSLKELYFEFVDANHRILGNPNLEPEYGDHFKISFEHTNKKKAAAQLRSGASVFYNKLTNRIDYGQLPDDPSTITYVNIHNFESYGITIHQQINWKRFETKAGFRQSNFNWQLNMLQSVNFPKWKSQLIVFYKYNGPQTEYVADQDPEGELITYDIKKDHYQLLDVSVKVKPVKALSVQLGGRNLLNVTYINSSDDGSGAHESGGSIPISYGRSFFLKLNYQLNNIKKQK